MTKAPALRPVWHGPPGLRKLLVPIGLLAPHPSNPRRHDLPTIMQSLKELGQQKPIVVVPPGRVHDEFQTIVAGHGTTFAARELGWTHVAAVESDLEDADIERFVLADNRASDRAGYDDEVLARLLADVQERGGLVGSGYERSDLDDLLADLRNRDARNRKDSDDVPDLPAKPKSERGQVYELGRHRVLCGDAFGDDAAALYETRIDCVLTDPPYGISLDTDYRGMGTGSRKALLKGTQPKQYRPMIGDDQPFNAAPLIALFANVKEQFWFGGDYYRRTLSEDDRDGSWLVWDKRNEASDSGFGSGFELIWSRARHKRDLLRFYYFGAFGAEATNRAHPTQKPTGLLREILTRWTEEGAVIADPFLGSGSTLIAAELTDRVCIGIELDEGYCDVIRQRYADLVGHLEFAP